MLKISNTTPALIDLPVNAQLYDLAFNPLVKVGVAKTGQISPYEVERNPKSHCRVAHISVQGADQMVLIDDGDANVRPIPAPTGSADCSAQDAEIATLKATVTEREDRLRRSSLITTI